MIYSTFQQRKWCYWDLYQTNRSLKFTKIHVTIKRLLDLICNASFNMVNVAADERITSEAGEYSRRQRSRQWSSNNKTMKTWSSRPRRPSPRQSSSSSYSLFNSCHTQLYSPSKAATIKKRTKQRKRSEIKHCKMSNTIINTRPDIQHTVDIRNWTKDCG